jgi:hypothetical protein
MKEKEHARKKTVVVDISLIRELVVMVCCVLSTVALLAYLAPTGARAVASEIETTQAQSTGMRQFYLTKNGYFGNATKTACAAGYHFASLWEITDPSNLKYNTTLGYVQTDSGQGPPTSYSGVLGWVRTGYIAYTGGDAGKANCNLWTSASSSDRGSDAYLNSDWTGGVQHIGVWSVAHGGCQVPNHVWCVED